MVPGLCLAAARSQGGSVTGHLDMVPYPALFSLGQPIKTTLDVLGTILALIEMPTLGEVLALCYRHKVVSPTMTTQRGVFLSTS